MPGQQWEPPAGYEGWDANPSPPQRTAQTPGPYGNAAVPPAPGHAADHGAVHAQGRSYGHSPGQAAGGPHAPGHEQTPLPWPPRPGYLPPDGPSPQSASGPAHDGGGPEPGGAPGRPGGGWVPGTPSHWPQRLAPGADPPHPAQGPPEVRPSPQWGPQHGPEAYVGPAAPPTGAPMPPYPGGPTPPGPGQGGAPPPYDPRGPMGPGTGGYGPLPPGPPSRTSGKRVGLLVSGVIVVVVLSLLGGTAIAWQMGWWGKQKESVAIPPAEQTRDATTPTPPVTPRETPTSTPTQQETPGKSSTPSPTPQEVLEENPLYGAGPLPSAGCVESGSMPTSKANVERYYRNIIDCLNRSWPEVVENAGFEFREPELVVWSESVETPCGDYIRAFYCPANETIYMKWDDDVNQYNKYPEEYQKVYARMFASFQTAHEYGHHVQALTGIFDAYALLRHRAPDRDEELELSRRLELQSSCLGSMFWGANQPTYPITGESRRQWMHLVNHYGDEYGEQRDHGSEKNHGPWSIGGFKSEDPKSCNTWSAPDQKVS